MKEYILNLLEINMINPITVNTEESKRLIRKERLQLIWKLCKNKLTTVTNIIQELEYSTRERTITRKNNRILTKPVNLRDLWHPELHLRQLTIRKTRIMENMLLA